MDKHESRNIMKCHDRLRETVDLLANLSNAADLDGADYGRWLLIRQIESTLNAIAAELHQIAKPGSAIE